MGEKPEMNTRVLLTFQYYIISPFYLLFFAREGREKRLEAETDRLTDRQTETHRERVTGTVERNRQAKSSGECAEGWDTVRYTRVESKTVNVYYSFRQ